MKTEYKEDEGLPISGAEAIGGTLDSRIHSEKDGEYGLTIDELTIINEALGFEHNPPEFEQMTAKVAREKREKAEQTLKDRKDELVETIDANATKKERRNTADDTQDGRQQGKSSKWIEKIRQEQVAKEAKEA